MARAPPATCEDGFPVHFARLMATCDGVGLHALLASTEAQAAPPLPPQPAASGEEGRDPVATAVLSAWRGGDCEESLEMLCTALRRWVARYAGEGAATATRWMPLPMLWLCGRPRRLAAGLDRSERGERHQKKLVEVLREQFQKLHRDHETREGCLVVCCELLRLYFRLGQASQCSFLLDAVSKSQRGEAIDTKGLPKALGVTLCFLWGKHCVLDGNVAEAEARLGWALANCPPAQAENRRRILTYLVPCRLRFGRFPSRDLLNRHGLGGLEGIARAVAVGDVRRFAREFEAQEANLMRVGTYLVVEKLKLLAYRNLCRRVHKVIAARLDATGRHEHRHKQDLQPYEIAFRWQDDCDADETVCILANLIYIGAVRGYLSDEHQKIVFSKDAPFPPPSAWSPKA